MARASKQGRGHRTHPGATGRIEGLNGRESVKIQSSNTDLAPTVYLSLEVKPLLSYLSSLLAFVCLSPLLSSILEHVQRNERRTQYIWRKAGIGHRQSCERGGEVEAAGEGGRTRIRAFGFQSRLVRTFS